MTNLADMDLKHLVGREVGSCTLVQEIARGGMGVVFKAYQRTLKRLIAVKILPKTMLTDALAAEFQQEAEAAAILSHPNIIPIYEVGEQDDFLYFTMQLVAGKPLSLYKAAALRNPIPSRRALPVKAVVSIAVSLLDALDLAHRQEIVHRDVKPDNILLESASRRPILTDFGFAQVSRDPEDGTAYIVGTPKYMAPEQITNPRVDGRADIYAMGAVIYEMLAPVPLDSGTRSVREWMAMKLSGDSGLFRQKPSDLNPMVGKAMDAVVMKALSFDPRDRFATCRQFSEAFREAA